MPRGYEKMRDEFKKKGLSAKAAKTKAAKIWNANTRGIQLVENISEQNPKISASFSSLDTAQKGASRISA